MAPPDSSQTASLSISGRGATRTDRKVETGFDSPAGLRPVGERRKARKGFREFDTTPNATLLGREDNLLGLAEWTQNPDPISK
jgi:hypothetical protein